MQAKEPAASNRKRKTFLVFTALAGGGIDRDYVKDLNYFANTISQ